MDYIKIRGISVRLNAKTTSNIENLVRNAIDRFSHLIREVEVIVRDENGPRKGIDKNCIVLVRTYLWGSWIVKGRGLSVGEAVNRSCNKIKTAISKRVDRFKRGGPRGGWTDRIGNPVHRYSE